MSQHLAQIEQVLDALVAEHRKLLTQVDQHAAAMRVLNLEEMELSTRLQHGTRTRINLLEQQRTHATLQLARSARINEELTLTRLAQLFPNRAKALNNRKDELKKLLGQIQSRNTVAGKVAGALLGHLNTAVRIIASAAEQAGVYTKDGNPRVSQRIGTLEAVG